MANIYAMSDTWNASGTTFTAIKMDVDDQASASGSLLLDLQVGGSSKFKVNKDGSVSIGGSAGISRVNSLLNILDLQGVTSARIGPKLFIGATTFDLALDRDAANTLAQRNGTNAQTFNIYNTYTDASNYERGFMKWGTNVLEIGTEAAGTGTGRNVRILRAGTTVAEFKSGALDLAGQAVQILSNSYLAIQEASVAPSGLANFARIYAEDNGAGKTRLMVQFGTGAAQQIAIEP